MKFQEKFLLNIIPFFFLFSFLFQNAIGQTETPFLLELDKPIEREIKGGQTHKFQINLSAGQYAKVVVEQIGVDVIAKLFAADGSYLTRYDNEIRLKENESVEFVVNQQGNYQIQIQPTSKSNFGTYKIHLIEVRESTIRDQTIFEARMLIEKSVESRLGGKYDESLQLASRALEIAEKELGADHIFVARILNDFGLAQRDKGNYQAALPLLQRAYLINQKSLNAEHPQTVESYKSIADYYQKTREYAKSEKIYREILEVYERTLGKEHKILANTLTSFGLLMVDLNDLTQAENLTLKAKMIAEKHFDSNSRILQIIANQLGIIHLVRKEYGKAGEYFQKGLEISEKLGDTEGIIYYNSLNNLAVVYLYQTNYKKALEINERALVIGEKIFGKESPNIGILLNNIGIIYKATGNYEKALEIQRQALAIGEKSVGPSHRLMLLVIANIAKIYAVQGDVANAVKYQKLWDERFEKAASLEMIIGSERQKLAYSDTFPSRTSRTISLHLTLAKNNQEALDLGALVVLQRKGRVLDAIAGNLTALRQRATAEDRDLLDRFNKITTQLSSLTLNKPAKISNDDYQKQLTDLEEQKEKIEREISNRSAEFGVQLSKVTLDSIKKEIPSDAALIEFATYRPYDSKIEDAEKAYGSPRYVAYILQKNKEVICKEIGDKKTIDEAIDNFRQALRNSKKTEVKQLARVADEKIMQPLRSVLGNTKQLLVSPDGDLNLIPFEALIDENGKYLIEKYSFNYLTSGRDLLRLQTNRTSKNKSVILANPNFGEPSTAQLVKFNADEKARNRSVTAGNSLAETYFAPLSATMLEGRSIQQLFPEAEFLSGAQATETALKNLTAPRFLHIASHGFFLQDNNLQTNPENPLLRSGIALSGANQQKSGTDDGILTALEASGLNLWGTKLVVLSACDTGLGDVKNGEGVYGLRRAFTLAGTETLMMSLWEVSDVVTRELMTNYYKNLKDGLGRGESLRQTQLQMLKKREHPFYWAAFIQSGEWKAL